jgi:hypothetical protein
VALGASNRAESLRDALLTNLRAVRQRNHYEVALVSLNVFKVLDEKRLRPSLACSTVARTQIALDRFVACRPIELLSNRVSLLDIDRDDPERRYFLRRQVGMPDHEIDRRLHDTRNLGRIAAGFIVTIHADQIDGKRSRARGRECDEIAVRAWPR